MLIMLPNILGDDPNDVLHYQQDLTHYFHLDPTHRQDTNIYFMESTIRTKDNIWDIFEVTEADVKIYEHSYSQKTTAWIPPHTKTVDRSYL